MPHQLESFVGLEKTGAKPGLLIPALMLASAIALAAALVWDLQLYYTHGAATGNVNGWRTDKGSEAWNSLQNWLHNPQAPKTQVLTAGGLCAEPDFCQRLFLVRYACRLAA